MAGNFVPPTPTSMLGTPENCWEKGHFKKLFVNNPDAASNSADVVTTQWIREQFYALLHDTLKHSKTAYKTEWNGHICLGDFFGGFILQWGHVRASEVHFVEEDSWQRLRIPYNIVFPTTCAYREAHYTWENSQATARSFFIGGDNKQLEIDVPLNEQVTQVGIEWFAIGF